MIRVGWLADQSDVIGGAELTQAEFKEAAPGNVEIVDCPTGDVPGDCDIYVVHNCVTYPSSTIEALDGKPVVKYCHDLWPHGNRELREWLCENAKPIFISELQRRLFPWDTTHMGELCPPPVDLAKFRAAADNTELREGTLWFGHMLNSGKGIGLAVSWATDNGPVDFFGEGPLAPAETDLVRYKGPVSYDKVPELLATYERFVFLPTKPEPFGRSVVEAWAAGCEVVTNSLVGAVEWLADDVGAIEQAPETFWDIVQDELDEWAE